MDHILDIVATIEAIDKSKRRQENRCGSKHMKSSSLSPGDRILWILTNSGRKIERSRLRRRMAMKYVELDTILGKLAREGKIRISDEIIILI